LESFEAGEPAERRFERSRFKPLELRLG